MKANPPPPWALAALDANLEQIQAYVPKSWLPVGIMDEIGCGGIGCAWHTGREDLVFKLSTDEYEYDFAGAVMDMSRPPRGVARFYDSLRLRKRASISAGYGAAPYPTFALWREWVEKTCRDAGKGCDVTLFDSLSTAYGQAVNEFVTPGRRWPTNAQIRDGARTLSRKLLKEGAKVGFINIADDSSGQLYTTMHWIEDMMMPTEFRSVGLALRYFRERRMLLSDVNEDNIGLVQRGKSQVFAIFDAHLLDYRR